MGPLLQPVQVSLDGFPSFQCINCTTQLGVIRKLAEGALDAIIYVIDKDVEEHQSQDRPLRDSLHPDIEPQITTLWLQSANQFLIHQTVHLSNPYVANLERRICWRTMSKALQKSR